VDAKQEFRSFFSDDESFNERALSEIVKDSAPVCLRRPAVLAPCTIVYGVFADQRILLMNRVETPRLTRGPPVLLKAA
jgi:hypothetical protein